MGVRFTEDLFVNTSGSTERTLKGRVVPAMMLYWYAEDLVSPSVEFTGQAFVGTNIGVKSPTVVGDTIHVSCEVVEPRPESKGQRGLVRTRNEIINQRNEVVVIYTPLRLVAMSPPPGNSHTDLSSKQHAHAALVVPPLLLGNAMSQ